MRLPEFRMDSVFIFSLAAATLIGLLNLYSAGVGQEYIFARQTAATVVGLVLCAILSMADYRDLRKYSFLLYVCGNLVLLATSMAGHEVKSTRAWLNLGIFSIQPSELFKGVFVLYLAAYLSRIQREHKATLTRGLLLPAVLLAVPVAIILHQHDAGTAAVYIPLFFVMLYMADLHFTLIGIILSCGAVAGVTTIFRVYAKTAWPDWDPVIQKYFSMPYLFSFFGAMLLVFLIILLIRLRTTHFRGGGILKIELLVVLILFAGLQAGDGFYRALKPHQKNRIASFIKPRIDPRGAGYQAIQAKIAVGSGGIFGKGYLKGTQKRLGFLPEQWTDFAFSVLAEEWGFAGSVVTLLIYALLIGSAIWIGRHATDLFGCLLAVGVATLYFVHMSIGVAMNLGAFPVVGIPMPFLSYGGSAQVLNLAAAGLIISVARHRRLLAA